MLKAASVIQNKINLGKKVPYDKLFSKVNNYWTLFNDSFTSTFLSTWQGFEQRYYSHICDFYVKNLRAKLAVIILTLSICICVVASAPALGVMVPAFAAHLAEAYLFCALLKTFSIYFNNNRDIEDPKKANIYKHLAEFFDNTSKALLIASTTAMFVGVCSTVIALLPASGIFYTLALVSFKTIGFELVKTQAALFQSGNNILANLASIFPRKGNTPSVSPIEVPTPDETNMQYFTVNFLRIITTAAISSFIGFGFIGTAMTYVISSNVIDIYKETKSLATLKELPTRILTNPSHNFGLVIDMVLNTGLAAAGGKILNSCSSLTKPFFEHSMKTAFNKLVTPEIKSYFSNLMEFCTKHFNLPKMSNLLEGVQQTFKEKFHDLNKSPNNPLPFIKR